MCRCPVPSYGNGKGDRNPSLLVKDGDRAPLLKCFAGCDVRDVLAELRGRGLLKGGISTTSIRKAPDPAPQHIPIRKPSRYGAAPEGPGAPSWNDICGRVASRSSCRRRCGVEAGTIRPLPTPRNGCRSSSSGSAHDRSADDADRSARRSEGASHVQNSGRARLAGAVRLAPPEMCWAWLKASRLH